MRAAVEVTVHFSRLAHDESLRGLAEIFHLEARAAAGIDELSRGADQAFWFSHAFSSFIEATHPFGSHVRSELSGCAPYVTATASTSADRAISRSWEVSPITRVLSLGTWSSSMSSTSIAGCGLGCVSSAQR